MSAERHADLMRQGFMKPAAKLEAKTPTIVACELCQNWHREGVHTLPALQPGACVYVTGRLFGGVEEHYGVVVTGKPRSMRIEGVGVVRPHVRVSLDGEGVYWICVDELRQR
jgi:hypothetical protein